MRKKIFLIAIIIVLELTFQTPSFSYSFSEQAQDYREKGYQAQQVGNIEDAISYYQKAASLDPRYPTPHNDLGIIYEAKGWLDRAEEEYKKALELDPDYAKAHTNLALLYDSKGETEKAAFHWMKRYRLGKPDETWTKEAAERLEKLGLIERKERLVEKPPAREAAPSEVERPKQAKKEPEKKEPEKKKEETPVSKWTRLGSPRQEVPKAKETIAQPIKKKAPAEDTRRKQLEVSLKLAEEQLREEKRKETVSSVKSAHKYYNDAQNFFQNGEYVRALDSLRKAKEISPDERSIYELEEKVKNKMKEARISDHYNEGMRYFQFKNYTKAREEFEAILSILPE